MSYADREPRCHIEVISMLNHRELEDSIAFYRIRSRLENLWLELFLHKDQLDRVLFSRYGRLWPVAKTASRVYPSLAPYSIEGTKLTSEVILRSNQLWMPRRWEYPWAVINAQISGSSYVLDAGAGWSLFPLYLSKWCSEHVSASDSMPIAADVLGPAIASILKLPVRYLKQSVLDSPGEAQYDAIFCISVLEHLEEQVVYGKIVNLHPLQSERQAIQNLVGMLKPRGRLVLTLDYSGQDKSMRSFDADYVDDLVQYLGGYPEGVCKFNLFYTDSDKDHLERMWRECFPFEGMKQPVGALGMVIRRD